MYSALCIPRRELRLSLTACSNSQFVWHCRQQGINTVYSRAGQEWGSLSVKTILTATHSSLTYPVIIHNWRCLMPRGSAMSAS